MIEWMIGCLLLLALAVYGVLAIATALDLDAGRSAADAAERGARSARRLGEGDR